MMIRIMLVLVLLGLAGCTTVASRTEDGMMILKGPMGSKAKWADGAEIQKDSLIKIPDLPPVRYEQ
jgi:hypothetical protein